MSGGLVVFEGIDNCGKDTMINMLNTKLAKKYSVAIIPSTTNDIIGRYIRKEMINKYADKDKLVALFIADFFNKVKLIKDYISRGYIVLCNRWYTTTMAYHHGGTKQVMAVRELIGETIKPDLTIYLNISMTESIKRQRYAFKNDDIYTKNNYLKRAIIRYDEILKNEEYNTVVIDGEQIKKFVLEDILTALETKGVIDGR